MKVLVDKHDIFVNPQDLDYKISTKPKITKITKYYEPSLDRIQKVLEIELYCVVDQRNLYEGKVRKIEAYLSENSIDFYNSPDASAYADADMTDPLEVNNISYDIVSIREDKEVKKYNDMAYLTSFEPYRNFNKVPAKMINIRKLTDEQAFGSRARYKIVSRRSRNSNSSSNRRQSATTSSTILDFFESTGRTASGTKIQETEKNTKNYGRAFKNRYHMITSQGRDPMSIFQHPEDGQGMVAFFKGVKCIDKPAIHNHRLRKIVKKYATQQMEKNPSVATSVKKIRVSRRVKRLKTKLKLTAKQLIQLSTVGDELLIFAYDKEGNKIDSTGYQLNAKQILRSIKAKRPVTKFHATSTRNIRGKIITTIQNYDKRPVHLNVYTKKIFNYYPNTRSEFLKTDDDVFIKGKGRATIIDGMDEKSGDLTPLFGTSTPVFHRFTADYDDYELANSACSFVGPVRGSNDKPYCSFYAKVVNDADTPRIRIRVSNVSQGVNSFRVLKRVVSTSLRGQNYIMLRDENFAVQRDVFITSQDDTEAGNYSVDDYDIEDDVTYEYVVQMRTTAGIKYTTGHTCFEKYMKPSSALSLTVKNAKFSPKTSVNKDVPYASTVKTSFLVSVNVIESDVDKLLNSVHGDAHELFKDEFSSVKDASNLIYGVKVHRINRGTGETNYVGNFKAAKSKTSSEKTEIEGYEQAIFCTVTDTHSPFYNYEYKIEPYIMPPSHVLDKVDGLIANLARKNFKKNTLATKFAASAAAIRKNSASKTLVSSVGSKFASVKSNKGAISSNRSLLTTNSDELFSEGLTGDILYFPVKSAFGDYFKKANFLSKGTVKKLTYFQRHRSPSIARIRKSYTKVRMKIDGDDRFVDFYIILKRENAQKDLLIDGAVHSWDSHGTSQVYNFISKCVGSFGAIEYFVIPVAKDGTLGALSPIGAILIDEE